MSQDKSVLSLSEVELLAECIHAVALGANEKKMIQIRNLALSALEWQGSGKWVPLEPTKEMIEDGAQRLVRWETGKETWPDSWSALDVRASRNDAERVWRSMWLAAAPHVSAQTGEET